LPLANASGFLLKIEKVLAKMKNMKNYNHKRIERKWQKFWLENKIFEAKDISKKPKLYILDMFPYPSAAGLHVGHLRGYTISDVITKKRLMEGYNVLHPMGWDAFGLPAENFAIKTGIHPQITTQRAIKNIKRQLIRSGLGYDWQREINTSKSEYYKFTQWVFLKLFQANLAYKKLSPVNFCPSCKTVLAREQVIDGKCERCSSEVEKRELEQWFFKITDYAERLLKDLDKIDWPENIKVMQRNWIGKSEGTVVKFPILNLKSQIEVFTTRVDTIFGCTYLVIAPEHPVIKDLKSQISNLNSVERYIEEAKKKTEIERLAEDKEKTGIKLEGILAENPINGKKIPVFVGDYILVDYATGAVMGVPAHDQRDFIFAKKHNLEILEVIKPKTGESPFPQRAFEEDGILINSGPFSGLDSQKGREEITKYLEKRNLGKKAVYYKLRDWCISRQRYWGAPIPIIYCPKCGQVPVPEKDLPVILPKIKDFLPTGEGKSPLAKVEKFVKTRCPKCKGPAERETDTMDTFVCSSWYYFRYTDPKNEKEFASKKKIEKWLPVDLYIGGAEHAVMHLLYARFLTKVFYDLGYINFDEPFLKLFNQGTIYYKGAKMSKSKGNVVSPEYIFDKYGADTLRLYELFMGPADQATEWQDKGVIGCYRFLQRVWKLQEKLKTQNSKLKTETQNLKLLHKTIKKVTEDIESFRFNTAISSLMVLVNTIEKEKQIDKNFFENLIKLLAPMAPHLAEELWERLGHKNSIFKEKWPKWDEKLVKEEMVTLIIQVNGKVRDKIEVEASISKEKAQEIALSLEKIKKWTQGKEIKKVIFVPGKLINIVV
jgi:leucyl-tRNA synthetase